MFSEAEAQVLADRWVNQGRTPADRSGVGLREFDLGYVVWAIPPPDAPPQIGAPHGVIDRQTGELSIWPSVPVEQVIEMYQEEQARRMPVPRTWDPVRQARRDLTRAGFPESITHLTLRSGRVLRARSMKGDGEPNLHPLVAEALAGVPDEARERGRDRCAEVAALSDALLAEDSGRAADHRPPITLDYARTELFRGADVVTYAVREPDDPLAGAPRPPCLSCYVLLQHFGFRLMSPGGSGGGDR